MHDSQLTKWQPILRWLPIVTLISLAVLLWLPFGLNVGFYADEWTTLQGIQAGAFLTKTVRPFELIPWSIAYHISPDDLYFGMNLALLVIIAGKAVACYGLLSELKLNKLFAFGTAALLILYPADSGTFYMGAISIHTSILTYLIAVWLLVRYWLTKQRLLWIPITLLIGFCAGIYEGIYPLIIFAPLVLVWLEGKITRRVIMISLLWFIAPFILGLRLVSILFFAPSGSTYQSNVLATDHSIGQIVSSLIKANRYALFETWDTSIKQTLAYKGWSGWRNVFKSLTDAPYLGYALGVVIIVVLTGLVLTRNQSEEKNNYKHVALLILAGLMMLTLGFLLYSVTIWRGTNTRTFLHASIGAALCVSAFLWLIGGLIHKQKFIYIAGLAGFVFVGTCTLLSIHNTWALLGKSQTPFLRALITAVPQLKPDSTLVIMDDTPNHELQNTFNGTGLYLIGMTQIIYSDSTLSATVCYTDTPDGWGVLAENCIFKDDVLQITYKFRPAVVYDYDRLIIFRYSTDHQLTLETDISRLTSSAAAALHYNPHQVGVPVAQASLPVRAHTMLDME